MPLKQYANRGKGSYRLFLTHIENSIQCTVQSTSAEPSEVPAGQHQRSPKLRGLARVLLESWNLFQPRGKKYRDVLAVMFPKRPSTLYHCNYPFERFAEHADCLREMSRTLCLKSGSFDQRRRSPFSPAPVGRRWPNLPCGVNVVKEKLASFLCIASFLGAKKLADFMLNYTDPWLHLSETSESLTNVEAVLACPPRCVQSAQTGKPTWRSWLSALG